jgi:hypothetical protein
MFPEQLAPGLPQFVQFLAWQRLNQVAAVRSSIIAFCFCFCIR